MTFSVRRETLDHSHGSPLVSGLSAEHAPFLLSSGVAYLVAAVCEGAGYPGLRVTRPICSPCRAS